MTADVPVITIDGPSGSGKGTLAGRLARRLGFALLDSGALYRLVGIACARQGVPLTDAAAVADCAARMQVRFEPTETLVRTWLGDEDVSDELRTESAGERASIVAQIGAVRLALRDLQRNMRRPPGLVADGRDMGTEVFPDAVVKIFLTASIAERARRRQQQLLEQGIVANINDLAERLRARDERDTQRSVAPLRPAHDAIVIDSSSLSIDAVLAQVLEAARRAGITAA